MNQLNVGVVTFTATGVLPGAEEAPILPMHRKLYGLASVR